MGFDWGAAIGGGLINGAATAAPMLKQAQEAQDQAARDERVAKIQAARDATLARLKEESDVRGEERKLEPAKRAASNAEGLISERVDLINSEAVGPVQQDSAGNPVPIAVVPEREQARIKAGAYEKEGLTGVAHQYRQDIQAADTLEARAEDQKESRRDRKEAAQLVAETKLELGKMNIDSRELVAAASNDTRKLIASAFKSNKDGTDRVLLHQTVSSIDRDIGHNQDTIKQLRAASKGLMPTIKEDRAEIDANQERITELERTNATLTGSKYEFLRGAGVKVPESVTAPTPAPKAVAPLSMPSSKKELVTGKTYNTARGPARWNGSAFEAVR